MSTGQSNFAPNTQLWAYGSRVKGTGHDASDLNLVVIKPSPQPDDADLITHLKLALQQSNIQSHYEILREV
ncbi:MAG: hypothetical protein ACI9FJ_002907 [Alteromonadaceae bacterium]|jgi:hypothetical protein